MIKTDDMILINEHNEYLLWMVHNNEFCRPPQLEWIAKRIGRRK